MRTIRPLGCTRTTTRPSRRRSCCQASSCSTRQRRPLGFSFPDVVTDYTGHRAFVNITPRLGVDYHFTDHVMGYVTYSRGFKSGGFDMRGNAAVYPQTEGGYGSETADNYEVGIKTTLLNDTLLFNLTVFYDPYRNAQIPVQEFVELQGCADESHRGAQCRQADQPGRRDRIGMAADQAADSGAQRRLPGFLLQGLFDSVQRVHVRPAAGRRHYGECRGRKSADQRTGLERIRKRDLHLGSDLGHIACARGL